MWMEAFCSDSITRKDQRWRGKIYMQKEICTRGLGQVKSAEALLT